MDKLGAGDIPGWRVQILGQGVLDAADLKGAAGQGLVFPMAIPRGSGHARPGHLLGPWGPIASFLACTSDTEDVPPSVTLGLEWPFTPLGISPPLTKVMAEHLHLQMFIQDWWEARASPPFLLVEHADRPDFRVRGIQGDSGLDMTRLTSERRRQAQHLFGQMRARIRDDAEPYSHLRGHAVAIWFPDPEEAPSSGLPPGRGRREQLARELMLAHLQRLQPASAASSVQECEGLPGAGSSVMPLEGLRPGTGFFDACGFELVLAYSTQHTADDVWREVTRVATDHDYEGCDRLIISVGTPAAPHGEATPADHLLWNFAQQQGSWLRRPHLEHIRTIDVHDWWSGAITRVYPQWERLAPGRRRGPVFPVRPNGDSGGPPAGWSLT